MARDLSIGGLFNNVSYDGHPLLWHLIIYTFAHSGFPYETMFAIHILISVTVVFLIVRYSPLPRLINFLFIFSYLMSFEYAIIARNYSISILFFILIALSYQHRFQHPYRYSVLVILLINTNIYVSFAGVALTLLFLYDSCVQKAVNRHIITGFCAIIASTLFLMWLLSLHPDRMDFGLVSGRIHPEQLLKALNQMLFHDAEFSLSAAVVYLVVFMSLIVLALSPRPALLYLFLFSYAGLNYVYIFKKNGGYRHAGLIFIVLFFVLWLNSYYQKNIETINAKIIKSEISYKLLLLFVGTGLMYSVYFGVKAHLDEWQHQFSGAKEAATYIKTNKLDGYTIVAHRASQASALLPYLPGKKFWYIYSEDYRTFITINTSYAKNKHLPNEEMIQRVQRRFGLNTSVLLLLTDPLDEGKISGYTQIYKTKGKRCNIIGHPDENFYIYKRKTASI